MTPGELLTNRPYPDHHTLNTGQRCVRLVVQNTSDRPGQVDSHHHFFETNVALDFEPDQQRTVELVEYAGERKAYGFCGLINGQIDAGVAGQIDAGVAGQIDAGVEGQIDTHVEGAL